MSSSNEITIYTDGGCTGNPGPGGWAAILLDGDADPLELSGSETATTNNRMELTAVIRALDEVRKRFGAERDITVHTDSQYVQKGISQWIQGWEKKGWKTASGSAVKNKDLWVELRKLDTSLKVSWKWVKGHAGNLWNERCDELVARERSLI